MASTCSRQLLRARYPHHAHPALTRTCVPSRTFSSTRTAWDQQNFHRKESFRSRLNSALKGTKIKWEPIPIALGIGFLGAFQLYRIQRREKHTQAEGERGEEGLDQQGRPKKRDRIRPSGPWTVQVMSTLPLKALSRVWGRFNEIDIPYYLRVPGFKLYSFIFGVNLDEVSEPDLHVYPNLAAFFYRTLKPGVRPLDPNHDAVLSPADGKVIQFGTIEHGEVEQVKGVTYSLDALLGSSRPTSPSQNVADSQIRSSTTHEKVGEEDVVRSDEEFAQVNGISYTLPNLFSGPWPKGGKPAEMPSDQSTAPKASSEAEVRADLAKSEAERPWWSPASTKTQTQLYYCVIYLAPGDYHRFHSPVSWVVESRRHFAGELYSVSPYLQRTMPGLFTLNERVVLLGRWRWGFFSYTPVGATNVGSIKINFDRELRTNSLTTDTAADRAAEEAAARGEPYSGFAEASYGSASRFLGGQPLKRGEEMGGFQLGSTIVMVFEAPKGEGPSPGEGLQGERHGGFKWNIAQGMKVKVGEALGAVQVDESK
ncbi:phosphatidylserine decarboxylase [Dothidotthia symphoricarpi CBS 119687]|uniref:Phosphatidylserine decarboxylase proenzyme 1, mitochondrial n=1 Tax=Dothidotthia symphoricarpi CBS 119687 TaxID=1392245 RepID=A0A6A6A0V4_9PLEO|nr:phosphatidylserine decarboxylase [Dothidotthia symphoricarpi CBS 119687]KAF2124783.1 phosphatidylserine decarboxylase [Dothidotthia symphoricarpi CBS 119687]